MLMLLTLFSSTGVGDNSTTSDLCGESLSQVAEASCRHGQVLVYGVLSLLGSRTAVHLAGQGLTVRGVSTASAISAEALEWYRWEQLRLAGAQLALVNTSNRSQVASLLRELRPQHLLLVPPGLEAGHTPPDTAGWGRVLESVVLLLEAVQTSSPCTRVLLASLSSRHREPATTSALWLDTLELSLATYHRLYGTAISVLRTAQVHGPWGHLALGGEEPGGDCLYVDSVAMAIKSALSLHSSCEVLDLGHHDYQTPPTQTAWHRLNLPPPESWRHGVQLSADWARDYKLRAQDRGQAAILSSYLTTAADSQRNRSKWHNRFQYISEWVMSLRVLGLTAVIFHDGMSARFQQRLMQLHPSLHLEQVPSLHGRSTNDARFYAYLSFLLSHPDLGQVLLTDISDVRFQRDPFELMAVLGDWLYVGTDIDIFPTLQSMPWLQQRLRRCFHDSLFHSLLPLDTVFNAGVLGGSRHTLLAALALVTSYLDSAPHHLNCNMAAVNVALHKHLFERVFTGFPLSSRFLRHQATPRGVYIVHK